MQLTDDMKDILAECYNSTKLFATTFFPELYYASFSVLHDQIFELIDSGAPRIVIAAPRGIGKTTIARTVAAKGIVYRDVNFVPYISNSADVAVMQSENLKNDLITNEIIRKLFGMIKVGDFEEGELTGVAESFSTKSWVAYGNTFIFPRGQGQQIRGVNWRNHRPQLVIIDDLEKPEETQNEELRAKLKKWFFADVMKCINRYKKDWRFIYIDTLKHEDSLMQTLLDSKDWESLRLELCDDDLVSKAPSYMTTKEIQDEWESHQREGTVHVFYMEYRNKVTGGELNSFKQQYFKYFSEADLPDRSELETIVIYDPAKTINPMSAETGIVGISLHMATARIFIRDCLSDKMMPDDQYEQVFSVAKTIGATVIGIDTTGLKEFIMQPLRDFMMVNMEKYGFFDLIELHNRGGSGKVESKPRRVRQLIPYYRQGHIYHNPTCCQKLEGQLLSFPFSKLWDLMDAEAYMLELFSLGDRGFAPQTDRSEHPEDEEEDEFAELEKSYEPPLEWRVSRCP